MRIHYLKLFALLIGFLFAVSAQSQSRPPGWEFRADILYQNQKSAHTNAGSDVNLDTSWGGSLGAAYRFNPFAEVHMLLDLQSINYDGTFVRADLPNVVASVTGGKVDVTTPRVVGVFNFMDNPITPFVSAGIGWSFVHATDPWGHTTVGCWWDPWWGYICSPYSTSYNNDHFAYDIGVGVRWDLTPQFGLRFAYEKHWVDLSGAAGTPNFDQIRIGMQFAY
jgi:opacity protein-like surface antigen